MAAELKALVGLGNPGDRYHQTRHNAGFWFIDLLAAAHGGEFRNERRLHGEAAEIRLDGQRLRLLKPDTYVNESGQAMQALLSYYRLEPASCLVIYDELDLAPGVVRFKRSGGHGGHNGLRSIMQHLGVDGFPRLRLGIGHPGHRSAVTNYVLSRPPADEQALIDDAIGRAVEVMAEFATGRWDDATKRLHTLKGGSSGL